MVCKIVELDEESAWSWVMKIDINSSSVSDANERNMNKNMNKYVYVHLTQRMKEWLMLSIFGDCWNERSKIVSEW